MNTNRPKQQKLLPFEGDREAKRLERVERLLGTIPKLSRASAPTFDYEQATAIARGQK
jgi:hypothetical protein